MAGDCLLKLGDLLARAGPGQVALSKEAQNRLALSREVTLPAELRERASTAFNEHQLSASPEVPVVPAFRLECFLPPSSLPHGGFREIAWLAEFRVLTVLCVCLPKLRCSRIDDLVHIQNAFSIVQQAIFRYEGTVLSVSMNEKGPMVLAAFGLPNQAHEDDAARALAAAHELQNTLSVTGIVSRCAVTNGIAYCGVLGNNFRRTYTIMGDVVNRGAKLASSGDEPVIIRDPQTEVDARRRLRPSSLASVEVVAASDAIIAAPPGSAGVRLGTGDFLVGRETELLQLRAQVTALIESGRSATMYVVGEPGIGKSALVHAIRDFAAGRVLVWHSAADPLLGGTTPYGTWKPIFAALFGRAGPQTHEISVNSIRDTLERQGQNPALSSLASAVLAFVPSTDGRALDLSPEDAGRMTRSTLISLLRDRQQGQRCVIILEDTHWMDASSWSLALQATNELEGVLILLISRPVVGEIPPAQREFFQSVSVETFALGPVSREATKAILAHMLDCSGVASEVTDAIHNRAAGNPFHIIQLGMALRENGALAIANGICRVASHEGDLSIVKLPDTVQRAILTRFDRLPVDAQITLKVASIFGTEFSSSVLFEVLPVHDARDRMVATFDRVRELGVINLAGDGPAPIYRFNHALTQEVLYGLIPFTQRRQLHRAAAEFFETSGSQGVSTSAAALAYHWSHAEEPRRALPYWEKAGNDALAKGAYREAADTLSKAIKIIEADPLLSAETTRLGKLHRHLGDAYLQSGDVDLSRQQLAQALSCFGYRWPHSRLELGFDLFRQIARQFWQARRFGRLRSRQLRSDRHLEAARVYDSVAQVCGHSMEIAGGLLATLSALNISQFIGDRGIYSLASGWMALAMLVVPNQRLAKRYFEHCRDTRPEASEPHDRLMTTEYLVMFLMCVGRLDEAEAELRPMIVLAEQVHSRRRMCDATSLLILTKLAKGNLSDCAILLDRFSADTPAAIDRQVHCWARLERAELALLLGDLPTARAALGEADEVLSQLGGNEKIWAFGLRSLLHFRESQPIEAADAARNAIRLMKTSPLVGFYVQGGIFSACEVLLRTLAGPPPPNGGARKVGAGAEIRQMMRVVNRFAMRLPLCRPRALVLTGHYRAAGGNVRAAASCFRRALAESTEQRRPYEQALAHAGLASLAALPPREREVHEQAAAAIMSGLGMKTDIVPAPTFSHPRS